jgi:hypothetical protein
MEHENDTHEERARNRPQRPARRPRPRPGTRCRTRPRQPDSGRTRRAGANPGGTVAAIADALGTGRAVVRDSLLGMDKAGTATRVKGTRPGIPDTWTLAESAPDAAGPQARQPGQPGEDPAGSPDGAAEDETAGDAGQDATAGASVPTPEDGGDTEAVAHAAPGPATGEPEPHYAPAEAGHEDAVPDEQDDEAAPGSDPDDGDAPHDEDSPADAGDEPDPALVAEVTGHLDQIRAAADEAGLDLTASGDLKTVLAGLDEIAEQAAQARRALKAAIGGRNAPSARPGALRDKVLAHLDEHPGKEFTPHEIHKVLGHSSGAIANALDTLVKHGEAEPRPPGTAPRPHHRNGGDPSC